MEDLKQGQRISFNIDSLKGTGKVVGVATIGNVIIGKSYIIEPDQSIANSMYPYSHFVAFEVHLTKIS